MNPLPRQHAELLDEARRTAEELNLVSQPLGYQIFYWVTTPPDDEKDSSTITLTVRRMGAPLFDDRHFASKSEAREYLEEVQQLPWWRLYLKDASIEVDELVVTDRETGDQINLGGWKYLLAGATTFKDGGSARCITHLAVRSEAAPKIGQWYKWEG